MILIQIRTDNDMNTKVNEIFRKRVHSNGVNSIDMITTTLSDGTNLLMVVSGGDDGAICASTFEILKDKVRARDSIVYPCVSACCLTAIRANDTVVVASGSEQRLIILSVRDILSDMKSSENRCAMKNENRCAMKSMKMHMLDVADISSLDILDGVITVAGDGMCCFDGLLS